jgi:hypothetical protein
MNILVQYLNHINLSYAGIYFNMQVFGVALRLAEFIS